MIESEISYFSLRHTEDKNEYSPQRFDYMSCLKGYTLRFINMFSLQDLLSNLEDVIGSLNEDPTEAFQPSVGDICAARLQAEEGQTDNPWCRIKIDNILENDQVSWCLDLYL